MSLTKNTHAFKDFLSAELKSRGWSQADFIRELQKHDSEIGKATVSRWLNEANPTLPEMDNLVVLSNVLKVGVETMLSYPFPDQFYESHLSGNGRLLAERFDKFPEIVQKSILAVMREHVE